MIPTFIRSYKATAAVIGNRLVAFSDAANTNQVAQATGSGSPICGSAGKLDTALGGMCDVHRGGLCEVRLGGAVQAGDPLTSDANGKAVAAVAATGATVWIIGYADAPGAADDIIDYMFAPGVLHEG